MAQLRLNKILAQAGLASRRKADELIAAGRVRVNGVVIVELGSLADPERDLVVLDGAPVPPRPMLRHVMLHKPPGVLSTLRDPHGRPVVTDLVRSPVRLFPVGRLDAETEGLLLLTNDGALAHRLLHPRYEVPRVYEALVDGRVSARDMGRWTGGLVLEDGPARPLAARVLATGRDASTVTLTFAEGRKHEVRRYCAALGHPVRRLVRVAYGPLLLGTLPVGASRELTPGELRALRGAGVPRAGT